MAGPVRFGRYVLLDKLALGGMAEIFLAKAVGEAGFEKSLVIKKVLPHLTQAPGFVEMFLDEARIAAQLSHPGIVQIFDLGKEDGDYYFAMEYLAGEDLSAILRKNDETKAKMPVDVVVKIGAAAAEALHYAHGLTTPDGRPMGIVHRDISPSNLFVTYHGVVKVLDFGIARAEQRLQVTRAGHVKGKAAYMPPEQARGETVDCRADVWSLGVCLHEMLTGRRLFLRDSSSETLIAVREWPIPKPSQLRPELPPELDDLVMGALERDVSRRTKDAETLRRSLERYLADRTYVSQSVQLGRYLRELFGDARAEMALRRANASAVNGKGREGTEDIRPPALVAPAPEAVVANAAAEDDAGSIDTESGVDPHEQSTQVTQIPSRAVTTSVVARPRETLPDRPARRDTVPATDLPSVMVRIDETDPGTVSRTDPHGAPGSVRKVIAFGALVGGLGAAVVVGIAVFAGRTPSQDGTGGEHVVVAASDRQTPAAGSGGANGTSTGDNRATAGATEREHPRDGVGVGAASATHAAGAHDVSRTTIAGTAHDDGARGATGDSAPHPDDGRGTPEVRGDALHGDDGHAASDSHSDAPRGTTVAGTTHVDDGRGVTDARTDSPHGTAGAGTQHLNDGRAATDARTDSPHGTSVAGTTHVGDGRAATDGQSPAAHGTTIAASARGEDERTDRASDSSSGSDPRAAHADERVHSTKPSSGKLTVRANAPVTAYLDGKKLGAVPVEGVAVAAGEHKLKLENAALGISRTARVDVDAGKETTRVVTFSKGKMNVLVDPWADVFADGVKLGQTPLAGKELYEGRHQIRLVGPKSQKTVEVDVVAGKTVVVRESLP